MAEYKVVNVTKLDSDLKAVADSIKAKARTNTPLAFPEDFCSAIENIETGGGGELPEGYTRTGYVQFNSDMRFDTGIVCNENTKIKVVYTRDSDDAMYMYGVVNSGNTASVTAYLSSGGSWRFGAKSASYNVIADEDLVHTAIVSKSAIIRVGSTQSLSGVTTFETIGSLIIGACRNANESVGAAQYIGKIYEFKMYDGDELILDFIPCIDSNGAYCFFDNVKKALVLPT